VTYIPIVPVTPTPPSPQAVELAARLTHVIREYEQANPGMSRGDVDQAVGLARQATGSNVVAPRAVAAVLGGVVVLLLGVFVFVRQSGADVPLGIPLVAGVIGVMIVGLLAVWARREP
jgi:hypothetical protein